MNWSQINSVFLLGVTYDLCDPGIKWLAQLLGKPDFKCRLVLLVYPACATRKEHLMPLAKWQRSLGERFAVRLLLVSTRPITAISFSNGNESERLAMAIGGAPNLGIGATCPGIPNFFFHPDLVLHERRRRWFDELWEVSVPLTAASVAMANLVPAKKSPEASKMWSDYLQVCYSLIRGDGKDVAKVPSTTPETDTVNLPPNEPRPSETDKLNVPRHDELSEYII